jgi:hypothetical protein
MPESWLPPVWKEASKVGASRRREQSRRPPRGACIPSKPRASRVCNFQSVVCTGGQPTRHDAGVSLGRPLRRFSCRIRGRVARPSEARLWSRNGSGVPRPVRLSHVLPGHVLPAPPGASGICGDMATSVGRWRHARTRVRQSTLKSTRLPIQPVVGQHCSTVNPERPLPVVINPVRPTRGRSASAPVKGL